MNFRDAQLPNLNSRNVTIRRAFVHELRRQFAYADRPIVIEPTDIKKHPGTLDAWRARVQIKFGTHRFREVLLTSNETVEECLRGFALQWVSQTHVVIHGRKVDGQLTVG
jgi:hypothetical protein